MHLTQPKAILSIAFVILLFCVCESKDFLQPEKPLLENLFKDYERDALPVTSPDDQVSVNVSFIIKQIIDMDIRNQLLTTHLWLKMEWMDKLLRWNPEDYSGIKDLRLPLERVWMPDLELGNSGDETTVSLSSGHTPVVINHNGTVFWIEAKETTTMCKADVTWFPFDRQTCQIDMGSWTRDGNKMDVQHDDVDKFEVDLGTSGGEWRVLKTELSRTVNYYSSPEPYIHITVSMELQRNSGHYLCNTIIPCVMLSIIALITVTMPPDSILRIGVETLILISFSHVMTDLTSVLPISSKPLIIVYLILMMTLTYSTIAFTAVIWKLYRIGMGTDTTPLPKWMWRLILSCADKPTGQQSEAVQNPRGNERQVTTTTNNPFSETTTDDGHHRQQDPQGPYSSPLSLPGTGGLQVNPSRSSGNPSHNSHLLSFVDKLDRIGLWFFTITILLVNFSLFILAL